MHPILEVVQSILVKSKECYTASFSWLRKLASSPKSPIISTLSSSSLNIEESRNREWEPASTSDVDIVHQNILDRIHISTTTLMTDIAIVACFCETVIPRSVTDPLDVALITLAHAKASNPTSIIDVGLTIRVKKKSIAVRIA